MPVAGTPPVAETQGEDTDVYPLTLNELIEAVRGRLLFGKPNGVAGLSIDSRTIGENEFFVAIKGERFDGHDFLREALSRAAGAIVSIPPVEPPRDKTIVHVENTVQALHDIARHIRRKSGIRVVGITGTNGKTTTKEMLSCALSMKYRTHKNTGNLNNQIGLPLSIFRLGLEHEAAVFEMGASMPGDIRELCAIAEPDIGVLTNIGQAHLEGFGSVESIRRTKLELMQSVKSVAVNADDAYLMAGLPEFKGRLLRYGIGPEEHDVYATDLTLESRRSSFRLNVPAEGFSEVVALRTPGMFNIRNALAATAGALLADVEAVQVAEGLRRFEGVPMRTEIRDLCGATVISDVYNANPSSMEEALKELLRMAPKRRIAVLGDMLELGSWAETAHEKVGRWMAEVGIEIFIAVGPLMGRAAAAYREAGGSQTYEVQNAVEAGTLLCEIARTGDTALVKGSRGMKMERVIQTCDEFRHAEVRA